MSGSGHKLCCLQRSTTHWRSKVQLINVALITPFATKCADFFNERLTEGAKTDWDRKTTGGEVVQFWGYLVALALNPSVPVADAWATRGSWETSLPRSAWAIRACTRTVSGGSRPSRQ